MWFYLPRALAGALRPAAQVGRSALRHVLCVESCVKYVPAHTHVACREEKNNSGKSMSGPIQKTKQRASCLSPQVPNVCKPFLSPVRCPLLAVCILGERRRSVWLDPGVAFTASG